MHRPSFNDQLRAALNNSPIVHSPKKSQRAQFLKALEDLSESQENTLLISRLHQVYPVPLRADQERLKATVLKAIREESPQDAPSFLWSTLVALPRKATALGFALILLLPAFFGPLQLMQTSRFMPSARAAYVECTGEVYLNNRLCTPGQLATVVSGDSISTTSGSFATIFFNDFTLARLNAASEAIIANLFHQQIQVVKGSVWLHTQGDIGREPLKVSTSALKAQVPQGAAGVMVNGLTTQLITTNSALEVQIENASGGTKLVTLAPDKKLTVRKSKRLENVRESPLDRKQLTWVRDNTAKDEEHIAVVKQKALEENATDVAALPGSVRNFVSKATHSARTALTWDSESKFDQNLSAIDSLFAETLALLNKGDKTIAETNFEAYRTKFISLVQESSVSIDLEHGSREKERLLSLLQKHAQLVSPFSPEDDQYALKNAIQKLVVNLDPDSVGASASDRMIADVSLNKLLEAHTAVIAGNLDLAKNMLTDTLNLVIESPSSLSGSPFDLALLDAIAEKSPLLASLALDIKKKKLDQLRSITPEHSELEVVGTTITGTAYKTEDKDLKEIVIQ
jgi:hypothetical protein